MKIGEIAGRVGITVEAVRFYEKKGLVAAPLRDESGYRNYPPETVERVAFIGRAKELGFSLKEIGELLKLQNASGSTCGDVREQTVAKIADVDRRIEDLQRIREALTELVASCSGQGPLSECPIIESIKTAGGGK